MKLLTFILMLIYQQTFWVRSVHGKRCDDVYHPYAVAIFSKYVCGGTLISLQWILTNRDCVEMDMVKKRKVTLRTGFNRNKFAQVRTAERGIQHNLGSKHRGYEFIKNDIGLLLADRPFRQTAHLRPAKIPILTTGSRCTPIAVGIGEKRKYFKRPRYKAKLNEPLYCKDMRIISQYTCRRELEKHKLRYDIDENIICAMDAYGKKDGCYGEPGNSLVCGGNLIGFAVARSPCAIKSAPTLYIAVSEILNFIAKSTESARPRGLENGSNKIASSRVLLIIVLFLHYIMINVLTF